MKLFTHKIILSAISISFLIFTSCSDFFKSPLTDYSVAFVPKLYLFSVISPNDTIISVEVKRNTPIVGNTAKYGGDIVRDARVILIRASDTLVLKFDSTAQKYNISTKFLKIQPKATYQLFVNAKDGLMAQSECTVPDTLLKYDDVDANYTATKGGFLDSSFTAQVYFKNLPGESDFYDVVHEQISLPFTPNAYVNAESWGIFHGKNNLGDIISTNFFNYDPFYRLPKTQHISRIRLLLTDENYYRYHQSIKSYKDAKDNPFAEDSPIYTNVKGGLGIFCAFTQVQFYL